MKSAIDNRDTNRIKARYSDGTKKRIMQNKRKSHSVKLMEKRTFGKWVRDTVKAIDSFFRRIFKVQRQICSRKQYVYDGQPRPKGNSRYDVYMRRRGRKYKKARAS